MVSPTTTFRLNSRDRTRLERLADELLCKRTDVIRLGMAALTEDPALRRQIRADNLARLFLQGLRAHYGENAVLELLDGPANPEWRLAGDPLDPTKVRVSVRHHGDRFVMDLIDPTSNVGIHNVHSWEDPESGRHAVVALRDLWVHSANAIIGEPKARQTFDGRTVVDIEEDDGTIRQLILDHEGNSRRLNPPSDVPIAVADAADPHASVGIGVRRESKSGPHLGRGVGGSWKLTGDLEEDRAVVIGALQQLVDATRAGELDAVLSLDQGPTDLDREFGLVADYKGADSLGGPRE